ncbi:hypothetical protein AMATHDRAFT_76510 [Amanita thiersii Skay4041]|uniref:Uncharacterized protein n=1 Tax=Amanita thiersii Skay4041 TaxID=703135 RepID=A0A2A9NMC7_9AGAR|nr:hypothetical protein AMATHDRAFT_76510 [Amanita thiersii Skay4041]
MSQSPSNTPSARGRGKSRGGRGKYLRARGRRGYGRPAEFSKRLLLEGERGHTGHNDDEEEDEEAREMAAENARKYSRRQLTTNVDRYEEPDPELGSDGEPIQEPEVDLSTFLEKQNLSDDPPGTSFLSSAGPSGDIDDDDIDHSITPLTTSTTLTSTSKKGKLAHIEWTPDLEALSREKAAAEAAWDLKARFRANSEKFRARPGVSATTRQRKTDTLTEAPPLPLPEGAKPPEPKDQIKEMEDFLDELLR